MNKFEEIGQKTEYIKYDVFYDEHARILTVKDVADFDLTHIFECGQCFDGRPQKTALMSAWREAVWRR